MLKQLRPPPFHGRSNAGAMMSACNYTTLGNYAKVVGKASGAIGFILPGHHIQRSLCQLRADLNFGGNGRTKVAMTKKRDICTSKRNFVEIFKIARDADTRIDPDADVVFSQEIMSQNLRKSRTTNLIKIVSW